MNFFEHQARAKSRTRWLLFLFLLAVIIIVAAVDLVLLLALGMAPLQKQGISPLSMQGLSMSIPLLIGGAIASVTVISLASLYRMSSLRSGGGQVARELGGTLVESEPGDPLRRRLRNVVEEIALASGVPVPEIYVLEREAGINAFAAGYSASDAAIAVTRGCLEKLNRNELQGVIAHEFSHVLNGDMRLNIRLMGTLFGILLLAVIGRRVLLHTRHIGRSRDKNVMVIFLIAFGLLAIGYIGQFFGRWIKSAVSREREYLADASAVQFTRDNLGIGGALKKIAVHSGGSLLVADSEEVGHMLFGSGRNMALFSTHPPIEKRIKRVDPYFRPEELERIRAKLVHEEVNRVKEAQKASAAAAAATEKAGAGTKTGAGVFLDPASLIESIGKPGWENILLAATVTESIPLNVRRAAKSPEWATAVLFYTLLEQNNEAREQQLLLITSEMGGQLESQIRALADAGGLPVANQRLPLLEMAFPSLKRHPDEYIRQVLVLLQKLVALDGRVEVFEYLLSRITMQHLWESQDPAAVRTSGRKSLTACQGQVLRLLAIIASHGDEDQQSIVLAFNAGTTVIGFKGAAMPIIEQWPTVLDQDLQVLDALSPAEKQKLLAGLVATVMKDGKAVVAELELLRAVCDLLHVPLPMLSGIRR